MTAQPSDGFVRVFLTGTSPRTTCGFCGKFHFASGPGTRNTDEEIRLWRDGNAVQEDFHVDHPNEASISVGTINGVSFVKGCCAVRLAKYEQFLIDSKPGILAYYKAIAEAAVKTAQADLLTLEDFD